MQVLVQNMSADGTTDPIVVSPQGAKTLVVEGDLGGGTITFDVSYFGITQNPVNGTNGSPLSMTAAGIYDIFYLGGGIRITATLTGSTTPSVSIGIG